MRPAPFGALLALTLAACSPLSHVEGAELVSRPPDATAGFVAHACSTPDGHRVESPVARYYVTQGRARPLLYEMTGGDRGMRITNGWTDEAGAHFFAWIPGGPGYHYLFPRHSSFRPRRDVLGPGYRVHRRGRGYVGVGSVWIRCTLRPIRHGEWSG